MTAKDKKKNIIGSLLKYVVPLVISVGLCYLLFTGVDFKEMTDIIRNQCDFRWIGLAMGLSIFSHVFRAMRWRIQLAALGIQPPVFALVLSIFGTYAVNLVFPRLGELWRTSYIAQRQRAPFTSVFGSMVADRVADTVTVLLLTLFTFVMAQKAILGFLAENGESYAAIGRILASPWLWTATVAFAAAVWVLMTRRNASGWLARVQSAVRELWQGFAVVFRMPGRGKWLLWTVALWGSYFLTTYIAFFAFPFTRDILAEHGVLAALVTFVLSSISMGVPSNGGIGPWQWAVIFALSIYGLDRASAGAYANLVMGCQTLLLIALGIFTFVCIAVEKRRHAGAAKEAGTENSII